MGFRIFPIDKKKKKNFSSFLPPFFFLVEFVFLEYKTDPVKKYKMINGFLELLGTKQVCWIRNRK